MSTHSVKDYSESVQTEVDAAFLYLKIAEAETDPGISNIFRQLSDIEGGHARGMLEGIQKQGIDL